MKTALSVASNKLSFVNATQRLELIRSGVHGDTWADFGAGSGAFTMVLLEVLGSGATVFAVDKDLRQMPQHLQIKSVQADFTQKLELPPLDGILLANSLHYIGNQTEFLSSLRGYLKPNGVLLIVEYQDRKPNPWVPYPVSFERLEAIASEFKVEKIGSTGSSFGGLIYAAKLTPSGRHY
jgi:ubiquinone/menaquinone biosynthesis C-methylase UbiE